MAGSNMIKEMKLYEFYLKYVWPLHRVIARRHLSARCSRCILSEKYSRLENGLCKECRETDANRESTEQKRPVEKMGKEFDSILKSYQGKGRWRFDALVLYSGGKDSTLMLYRLKTGYPGLRILALTVDNTFMSPVAMDNIKSVIRIIGCDHMVFRADRALYEKIFRHAFTHLNEKGCAGTVDQFDGDTLHDIARNLACQLKIPLVLSGLSVSQVEEILGLNSFESSLEKSRRVYIAGSKIDDFFTREEQKIWWDGTAVSDRDRPRFLFPYYAWGYDREDIEKEVVSLRLLDMKKLSPLLTNNRLIPLMGLVDMARLGYSSFEPEFAKDVREGRADRKHWLYTFEMLEYALKTGRFISKSVDEVLDRLGLAREDLGIGRQVKEIRQV